MSHSLKLLKGGLYRGTTTGLIRGDTRSLDYGSYIPKSYSIGISTFFSVMLRTLPRTFETIWAPGMTGSFPK